MILTQEIYALMEQYSDVYPTHTIECTSYGDGTCEAFDDGVWGNYVCAQILDGDADDGSYCTPTSMCETTNFF